MLNFFFSFGLEFEVQSNFPDNEVADMKDSHHKTDAYEKDLNKPLNDYKPNRRLRLENSEKIVIHALL
jgi:hypothetical protein